MISVIFTGGTISCTVQNSIASPDADTHKYKLLGAKPYHTSSYEVYQPYTILSENADAHSLTLLSETVSEILSAYKEGRYSSEGDDLTGIIITHGTDTLQYSAAFISLLFGDSPVPIVFVSANYPLDDIRSNGYTNFISAVDLISDLSSGRISRPACTSNVYVSYNRKVYHGESLLESKSYSDEVFAIKDAFLGEYKGSVIVEDKETGEPEFEYNDMDPADCFANLPSYGKGVPDESRLSESLSSILWIKPHPGMSYPSLISENSTPVKAVLLDSYHSGTIAINKALHDFSQRAHELDIPVYLTGLSKEGTVYETIAEYESLGIIPIFDTPAILTFCTLALKYI